MGDPMSPAICIATCAHIEMKWFDTLPNDIKPHVRFTRYLDDIYMIANVNGIQDYDGFLTEFTHHCYPSCLVLKETPDDEYLECKTKITARGNQLQSCHWNKNHEHILSMKSQYFHKHQHFHSYTTNHSKRGALIGTWTRMKDNTMDDYDLQTCIREKILELNTLSYPYKYVQHTLKYMHKKTGNDAWSI